jgi:hypothetical protein
MTEPLKSILVTDWSEHHVAGYDLDGGAHISCELDTSVTGYETVGYDMEQWSAGDIATLRLDPEGKLARLRFMTPKALILRVCEFQIFDIAHTASHPNGAEDACGRHIFLKGKAKNGAVYVMPMLGYTAWHSAWDFTNLVDKLKAAQNQPQKEGEAAIQLSLDIAIDDIHTPGDQLKSHIERYNEIFYPGSKQSGTLFDHATSLTVTTLSVNQTGPASRVQMLTAAFVKKVKSGHEPDPSCIIKMGTAFSPPYFIIDGERVFIRTSAVTI